MQATNTINRQSHTRIWQHIQYLQKISAGRTLCYIDEAGRGPIAGPLWIGVVVKGHTPSKLSDLQWQKKLSMFRDSKQCSERQRECMYSELKLLQHQDILGYASGHVTAAYIDRKGIVAAIRRSIIQGVQSLGYTADNTILIIDGNTDFGLRAKGYVVETIISGDDLVPAISAASIVAKVERDRYMIRIGKRHPHYEFQRHKGYGTRAHYAAIEKYGVCKEHRISYLKSLEGNVTRTSHTS